ncbi:hypothetical protein CRH01_44360 [Chryseobacterium rhizosphaerae]|nr:hypothetical protein CRH01_44360 [Chryseobacterium rhizosphaerae]
MIFLIIEWNLAPEYKLKHVEFFIRCSGKWRIKKPLDFQYESQGSNNKVDDG